MLYEIPFLQHVEPPALKDAVYWLSKYGERAKVIAGGTDLLGLIKDDVTGPRFPTPELLVNIKNIPGMKTIEYGDNGLRIGAAVTLTELEESSIINEKYPIIVQSARSVATLQIRNTGTIGGNLCQRPWCSYFRHPLFPCFKKGGEQCYAVAGDHRYYFSIVELGTCVASHPSDLAPALVALGATLSIIGPSGLRTVPIEKFFNGPNDVLENILEPNEIITEIQIPKDFERTQGTYLKDSIRHAWDLSLASAAVVLRMSGEICLDARIVLGGIAPFPFRSEEAERIMQNNHVNEATAGEAAEKALEKARGLRMTKYKFQIAQAIIRRAILATVNSSYVLSGNTVG